MPNQLFLEKAHMQATVMSSNSREQLEVGKQLGFFFRTGIFRVKGMVSRPKVLSSPLQECLLWQLASWMTCGTLFKSIFSLVSRKKNRKKKKTGWNLVIIGCEVLLGSCDFYIHDFFPFSIFTFIICKYFPYKYSDCEQQ